MNSRDFSIIDTFKYVLLTIPKHWKLFFFAPFYMVTSYFLLFLLPAMGVIDKTSVGASSILLSLLVLCSHFIFWFLSIAVLLGLLRVCLDIYDKGESSISRLFSCFRFVLREFFALFFVFPLGYLASVSLMALSYIFFPRLSMFSCSLFSGGSWLLVRNILGSFGLLWGGLFFLALFAVRLVKTRNF